MPIPVTCPACATSFRLARNLCGRKMFCPECGQSLVVSRTGSAAKDVGNAVTKSLNGNAIIIAVAALLVMGAMAVAGVGIAGGGITAAYYAFHRDAPTPVPVRVDDHRSHEHSHSDAPTGRERVDERAFHAVDARDRGDDRCDPK